MWFPVCRLSNHLQVRKVRISHFHSCLKFNPLTPTIIPGCASFRSSHHSGGSNLVTDHASFENKEGVGFVFLRFFNFSDFLSGKSCLFPVILDRGLRGGCEGVRRDVPHWTLTEPSLNPHWTLTEPPLNLYQIMKKFEGNVPCSMFRVPRCGDRKVWRVWRVWKLREGSVFRVQCSVFIRTRSSSR